jgi:quercetin dioxygenase-like cupin family protein
MKTLEEFKDWWMDNRPFNTPKINSIIHVAETHGVVLYRQKPYQVELFNLEPYSEIPTHTHPNVDSFEVFIGGNIKFICDGLWYKPKNIGDSIRILPTTPHGAKFGPSGGCFLSIQKWLNNIEPNFVGDDWQDLNNNVSYANNRKKTNDQKN